MWSVSISGKQVKFITAASMDEAAAQYKRDSFGMEANTFQRVERITEPVVGGRYKAFWSKGRYVKLISIDKHFDTGSLITVEYAGGLYTASSDQLYA